VALNCDVELLPRGCLKCQAVVHVIAVAGPDEIRGAGELVIAAEHGLRIIRVGVLEYRQSAGRRLETIVVTIGEVRAEATAMEFDANHDVGPAPDPLPVRGAEELRELNRRVRGSQQR